MIQEFRLGGCQGVLRECDGETETELSKVFGGGLFEMVDGLRGDVCTREESPEAEFGVRLLDITEVIADEIKDDSRLWGERVFGDVGDCFVEFSVDIEQP